MPVLPRVDLVGRPLGQGGAVAAGSRRGGGRRAGGHGDRRGGGRLRHEVAAIQRRCHEDRSPFGSWSAASQSAASSRRSGRVRERCMPAILTASRPCYHRATPRPGTAAVGCERTRRRRRRIRRVHGTGRSAGADRADRSRGCGPPLHDRLGWSASGRSPRAGREHRRQRLLPDGRRRRRRTIRGPGRPGDPGPHQPRPPARGRPREPRAGTEVGDRLGGHFVQGHVDTTATLRERRPEGEWEFLAFAIDPAWTPLLVPKGSIAVDGVSLTLVDVEPEGFSVMLIPHTLAVTTLGLIGPATPSTSRPTCWPSTCVGC